jgi:hypothetical protein
MDTNMQTVRFHEITETHAHGGYEDTIGWIPVTFTRQACRNHSFHEPRRDMSYWMDINQSEERKEYGSW